MTTENVAPTADSSPQQSRGYPRSEVLRDSGDEPFVRAPRSSWQAKATWQRVARVMVRQWSVWAGSPTRVSLLALCAGILIVVARLALAAHGQPGDFVVAGRDLANPSLVPHGIRVFPGTGYDGQFFYRIALDPANFSRRAFGIRIDASYRFQRIGYPAIAWLASLGGIHLLVPWSLIGVNLVSIGAVAYVGALLARQAGRHSAWGLLMVGYFGFPFSLSRDTAEIVTAAFTLGGVVALRERRWILAAVVLSAAVLTRETPVLVVFAYGILRIVGLARRRELPSVADLAWVLPGVVFVGWQGLVSLFSPTPVASDLASNLGLPFVAMGRAAVHWFTSLPAPAADLWVEQAVILIVVIALAGTVWRETTARPNERLAYVLLVCLSVSLAYGIWNGQADFRSFSETYLFAILVLFESRKRLGPVAVLVALAWLPVVVHQVVFI